MKIKYSNLWKTSFKVLLFLSTMAQAIALQGQQSEYVDEFYVKVRKDINGELVDFWFPIPTNVDPIGNPNASGTFGIHRLVRDQDRNKTNCNGNVYNYSEVQIDMNWFVDHAVFGRIDHSHNLAYWNHYYRDYTGPLEGSCVYNQNCHGHAFGVGDWPDHAWTLLNAYAGSNSCHEGVTAKDATIATDPELHSIIVTGAECEPVILGAGCGGSGEPGLGLMLENYQKSWHVMSPMALIFANLLQDPMPGDPEIGKEENFIFSSEQNRESGTYTQAAPCEGGGVDINKAHVRAGVVTYFFGIPVQGYRFLTYRPVGGNE